MLQGPIRHKWEVTLTESQEDKKEGVILWLDLDETAMPRGSVSM